MKNNVQKILPKRNIVIKRGDVTVSQTLPLPRLALNLSSFPEISVRSSVSSFVRSTWS